MVWYSSCKDAFRNLDNKNLSPLNLTFRNIPFGYFLHQFIPSENLQNISYLEPLLSNRCPGFRKKGNNRSQSNSAIYRYFTGLECQQTWSTKGKRCLKTSWATLNFHICIYIKSDKWRAELSAFECFTWSHLEELLHAL